VAVVFVVFLWGRFAVWCGVVFWCFGVLVMMRFGGLVVWWFGEWYFGGLVVWWFGGLVVW
jgi:hypothetical protein